MGWTGTGRNGEEGWKASLKEWSRWRKVKWLTRVTRRCSQSLASWVLVNGSSSFSRVFWLQGTENSTQRKLMPRGHWLTDKSRGRSLFQACLDPGSQTMSQALGSLRMSASSMFFFFFLIYLFGCVRSLLCYVESFNVVHTLSSGSTWA